MEYVDAERNRGLLRPSPFPSETPAPPTQLDRIEELLRQQKLRTERNTVLLKEIAQYTANTDATLKSLLIMLRGKGQHGLDDGEIGAIRRGVEEIHRAFKMLAAQPTVEVDKTSQ